METLEARRHSLAHLLAAAVLKHYPDTLLTLGPAIDNGFYYDLQLQSPLTPDALPKIEASMRALLREWTTVTMQTLTQEEAEEYFANNPFKLELIKEIVERKEPITLYTMGGFSDLCRGGHMENLSQIDPESFCLDRIAGAYWRGDEKNPMLTRIYGLAFNSKEELARYRQERAEAEKRDHRKLGEALDLFHFDEHIGKGLPLWLPHGNIIKEELERWAKDTEEAWGYQRITTPLITKENLFRTSGHLPLYQESMYAPITIEGEPYYLKPMNCPFHHKTYAARPKSYKDLPVRLAEYGWCHRYEDSGSLFGLMRVRGMQMNDAHIYVQKEKAVEEFISVIKLHEYYYRTLGIKNYQMELALRNPEHMEKYHGEESDWKEAEEMTLEAMKQSGVPYTVAHDGAAFYGPKMDFQIHSSIGRVFTASTNQLDLYMGKRFGLEYVDRDGSRKTPAIIHRAPLGTHERFIGFLIEHYAGAFPVWLSPVQVAILPVGEGQEGYAEAIRSRLKEGRIRAELFQDESLGKRIRETRMKKIPYQIVVGEKEAQSHTITVEGREGLKLEHIALDAFIERINQEIKEKI